MLKLNFRPEGRERSSGGTIFDIERKKCGMKKTRVQLELT
jgi:hypothetical protein